MSYAKKDAIRFACGRDALLRDPALYVWTPFSRTVRGCLFYLHWTGEPGSRRSASLFHPASHKDPRGEALAYLVRV